tara:strand:- start:62 stop:328 length:267 start_codon:yes stop_codon:yes gene_type:complete
MANISKLVNQFSSSIKHKPFNNELDKARTLGFIHALRDVLAGVPKRSISQEVQKTIPLEDKRQANIEEIKNIRSLRNQMKGNSNELDG